MNAVAPGPTITNIEATFGSPLGAERIQTGMAIMPDPVEADALAASITFLLSNDGVNVNGIIMASDGGLVRGVARGAPAGTEMRRTRSRHGVDADPVRSRTRASPPRLRS